jgi:hypothetical protein
MGAPERESAALQDHLKGWRDGSSLRAPSHVLLGWIGDERV